MCMIPFFVLMPLLVSVLVLMFMLMPVLILCFMLLLFVQGSFFIIGAAAGKNSEAKSCKGRQ